MKLNDWDMFRLEDRVLFEAAAATEIVDAAEAAQDNPNANVSESEKQAQEDRDTLKNAPPENSAAQTGQNDGKPQGDDCWRPDGRRFPGMTMIPTNRSRNFCRSWNRATPCAAVTRKACGKRLLLPHDSARGA